MRSLFLRRNGLKQGLLQYIESNLIEKSVSIFKFPDLFLAFQEIKTNFVIENFDANNTIFD